MKATAAPRSPDRLARKYAYQVMLVDECQRADVEMVFLNRELGQSPEDELLLQVQGMIGEYERAKMLERSRRGKRHKAQQGLVNVLCGAPYGYRYITLIEGGGQARYEILDEQAQGVRQVFQWVGCQRMSMGEVQRRLSTAGVPTPRGKSGWDRTSLWGILKNPAYQGQAAFGKTRAGVLRPRLRAQRARTLQPRRARSPYDVPGEQWLSIPVPAIVNEELFAVVQGQLETAVALAVASGARAICCKAYCSVAAVVRPTPASDSAPVLANIARALTLISAA